MLKDFLDNLIFDAGPTAVVAHSPLKNVIYTRCDMISVDPPWRQGNLSYWSHKEGIEQNWGAFIGEMARLFTTPYIHLKTGRVEKDQWIAALESRGYSCAVFDTVYYAGLNSQIVASRDPKKLPQSCAVDSRDATKSVIDWAKSVGVRTVFDPCAGIGKMADKWRGGGVFVFATELVRFRALKSIRLLTTRKMFRRLTEEETAPMVLPAKSDGVTIHPNDVNYGLPGIACAGIRFTNQSAVLRGCWVAPQYRGKGIGASLVLLRWFTAWASGAKSVRTFAFRPQLFEMLGMIPRKKHKIGTVELHQS